MVSRIRAYIQEKHMIQPRDNILIGISGGADSVCLLFVLLKLQRELELKLAAVHIHHGLRQEEADRDAAFVKQLCQEQNIPLYTHHCRVRERAEREKLSLEEAGRLSRYEIFEEEARRLGCQRIAVAHHADDQAETMLFHLFRGSGIKGLSGMAPVRGRIIRPLLCVEREDIIDWLRERNISWCMDSTNNGQDYTRNRIRHSILPCAKEQVNVRVVNHMAQAAEELAEVDSFLEEEVKKAFRLYVREEDAGCFVFEEAFVHLHPLLAGRMLRRCLAENGGLKDVDRLHIRMLLELMEKQTGSRLHLPGGRMARRDYKGLHIFMEKDIEPIQEKVKGVCPKVPGECSAGTYTWVFSLIDKEKEQIIPEKTYTKWFDYDKIEKYLEIRGRMPGDYLEINREHGRKKLKAYLIDEKVPAREREELLLLADGHHILWIPGMRISEAYKVTKETRRMLKVQLYGGSEHGGAD